MDFINNWLLLTRNVIRIEYGSAPPALSGANVITEVAIQYPRKHLVLPLCRLSVQAGEGNYCSPKNADGPWTSVECMVVSGRLLLQDEWDAYIDHSGEVYGYVPVELVNREYELQMKEKENE